MLATLLLFTGYLVCQLGSLAHGDGRHRATMPDETAQIGLMVSIFVVIINWLFTNNTTLSSGSSANSSTPWRHQR
jgi:hypothetical protein